MVITKKTSHLIMLIVHLLGVAISMYLLFGSPWQTLSNMQKFTRIILMLAFSIGFTDNLIRYRKERTK